MNKKLHFILETTWLIITILALGAAIHQTYKTGFQNSYMFYIIAFISLMMFSFRRYTRKTIEKKDQLKDSKNDCNL